MKSPLAPKSDLEPFELEPGLTAFRCPSSGGVWIDGDAYHRWVESNPRTPRREPGEASEPGEVEDSPKALLSPRSGRLLTKYRVGHGAGFRIDYDSATGGFWLDPGEYEQLKALGLHDELHLITGAEYQSALRKADAAAAREERFRAILGADYERACEVRSWLADHPAASAVRAFLLEPGP